MAPADEVTDQGGHEQASGSDKAYPPRPGERHRRKECPSFRHVGRPPKVLDRLPKEQEPTDQQDGGQHR